MGIPDHIVNVESLSTRLKVVTTVYVPAMRDPYAATNSIWSDSRSSGAASAPMRCSGLGDAVA